MALRISAGLLKNRKIKSFPGKEVRPLSGMIKEALFSILGERIKGALFLDLFAGTGSAGLEAISRGAEKAVFVEKNRSQINLIRENARGLGVEDRCTIICSDVFDFKPTEKPEIIFAGPPYRENLSGSILSHSLDSGILTGTGILIIQHHKKEKINAERAKLADSRKYGISRLDFFTL